MGASQAGMDVLTKTFAARFGLDQPVWKQYVNYLVDLAQFNLGYSISYFPARVGEMILVALPWTIVLVGIATLITFAIGSILGAFMAWPNVPAAVRVLGPPLLTLSAIPYYLLGLILIYVFAFLIKMFPLGGGYSVGMTADWTGISPMQENTPSSRPCRSCWPTWAAGRSATPTWWKSIGVGSPDHVQWGTMIPFGLDSCLIAAVRDAPPAASRISPKRPCACSMGVTISAAPKPSTTFARSAFLNHGARLRPGKSRPAALPDCLP